MLYFLTLEAPNGGTLNKANFHAQADHPTMAAIQLLETIQPNLSENFTLIENPNNSEEIIVVPNDEYKSDEETLSSGEYSEEVLFIYVKLVEDCIGKLFNSCLQPIED